MLHKLCKFLETYPRCIIKMQHLAIIALAVVSLIMAAVLVYKGRSESFKYSPAEQKAMCQYECQQMAESTIIGGQQTYQRCMARCATMFDDDTVVPAPYVTPFTIQ
jgi:hypothetical protein